MITNLCHHNAYYPAIFAHNNFFLILPASETNFPHNHCFNQHIPRWHYSYPEVVAAKHDFGQGRTDEGKTC
jgi:hypothetical protein